MSDDLYPKQSAAAARRRRSLAPGAEQAFAEFSDRVFAEGALPSKVKELIAVAVAHVTQCPYCIRSHTRRAQRRGARADEIMEAIWVAAEMRAGAAVAHAAIAVDAMESLARAVPSETMISATLLAHGTAVDPHTELRGTGAAQDGA